MSQLFINVVGHNSSGKTYLSKKLSSDFDFNVINGDDFRLFMYSHIGYFQNEKLGKRSPINDELNKFLVDYRLRMSEIILSGGQNVIIDGSGATAPIRKVYLDFIKSHFPDIKTVLIYVKIDEDDLLRRLSERDKSQDEAIWQDVYHSVRKDLLEPPLEHEADKVLIYSQNNYEEIDRQVRELLES